MDDVSELAKSFPSEHLDADSSNIRTKTQNAVFSHFRRQSINVDFYTPADPAWLECLGGVRADFYYLPGYVRLAATEEGGEPLLFVARDNGSIWLLPLIVRPLPARLGACGLRDAVSPYGYSGPLMHVADGVDPAEWSSRAAMALRTTLAQRGIVSLFVRLHPLRPQPLDALARAGQVVRHGETVVIDLTQSTTELWRQTRKRCHEHIRSSEREGFVVTMDPDLARLDQFRSIYEETMRRVGAVNNYFFSQAYYDSLRAALAGRLHLCVVERDDEIVGAGLFTEMHGTVQYHLSGTRSAFVRSHAGTLMIHHVRQWAKERGNTEMHLGGGLGGASDSLLFFKRGFSKDTVPFWTWRLIVDQAVYDDLAERQCASVSRQPVSLLQDYFPIYRRPVL